MSPIINYRGRPFALSLEPAGAGWIVRAGRRAFRVVLARGAPGRATALIDGAAVEFGWARRDGGFWITLGDTAFALEVVDERARLAALAAGSAAERTGAATVRAPLPGLVRAVFVAPGARVRRGQPILTLDAMKMENEIQSPRDGRVRAVHVAVGAAVEKDAALVTVC
jgi:acetyl/propionyl-CoA carboxylase alpha subunit